MTLFSFFSSLSFFFFLTRLDVGPKSSQYSEPMQCYIVKVLGQYWYLTVLK